MRERSSRQDRSSRNRRNGAEQESKTRAAVLNTGGSLFGEGLVCGVGSVGWRAAAVLVGSGTFATDDHKSRIQSNASGTTGTTSQAGKKWLERAAIQSAYRADTYAKG